MKVLGRNRNNIRPFNLIKYSNCASSAQVLRKFVLFKRGILHFTLYGLCSTLTQTGSYALHTHSITANSLNLTLYDPSEDILYSTSAFVVQTEENQIEHNYHSNKIPLLILVSPPPSIPSFLPLLCGLRFKRGREHVKKYKS